MFSRKNTEHKGIKRHAQPILAVSALVLLVFSVSGSGIPLAAAVVNHVVIDYGMGCGNKYWGIKSYHDDESGSWRFGSDTNCNAVSPLYYSRANTIKVHTAINTSHPQGWVAWQAGIEGADSGGVRGSPAPQNTNGNFPIIAGNNYNLHVQWLPTNDAKPGSTTSNIVANYLTDLWFTVNGRYVVIDFMWEQLKNNNGNWMQNTITDKDGSPDIQYSPIFCNQEGGIDVYHYNVVLDTNTHGMGLWADKNVNINTYISDAFNHSYAVGGNGIACSQSVPGFRTSASLIDLESGIELLTGASGATGKVEGGYSMSDLYY